MDKTVFFDYLINGINKTSLNINNLKNNEFYDYYELLQEFNSKFNLTGIKDPYQIIEKHFIDSLFIYPIIRNHYAGSNSFKLIDIGSGAGFPGIPLKIVCKNSILTLVESIKKKASFLQHVSNELHIDQIEVKNERAENIGHNNDYREKYDFAVSRALGTISLLIELGLPFLKKGGLLILPKGVSIDNELNDSFNAIKELKGELYRINKYKLPYSNKKGNIIIITKKDHTPDIFPRKIKKAGKF